MSSIASLGYVVINTQKKDDWSKLGADVLGLMAVDEKEDALFFKMDEQPFRITVEEGENEQFTCNGWQTHNEKAFEALFDKLKKSGTEVQLLDKAAADRRQVAALASAHDPSGNLFEFFYGRKTCARPFVSPLGISHFVTGAMGMGHAVLCAPDLDACYNFYTEVMGFGLSDTLSVPMGNDEIKVFFLHADNPRHHSVGLCNLDLPPKLVHLMVEVPTIDDVGKAFDRCRRKKIPLMATLGRHSNDNMLSFYLVSPSGFAIEYGCEGLCLDWNEFTPTISTSGDIWGHEYKIG